MSAADAVISRLYMAARPGAKGLTHSRRALSFLTALAFPDTGHRLAHCALDDERPRLRDSGAQRSNFFHTIIEDFCLRHIIESH